MTYVFTLILSTIKRKMKVSGNFAFPTMLQSVAWPSFSVYGGSLKIENWKSKIAINFCFRPKHSKSLTELLKREGVGSIRRENIFAPSALSLDLLPSMRFFFSFFFLSLPPSFPSHATLLRKGGSGKFAFAAQSLFQTWTTSVHSTLREFLHRVDLQTSSSRSTSFFWCGYNYR